jgi:hypothetical protein
VLGRHLDLNLGERAFKGEGCFECAQHEKTVTDELASRRPAVNLRSSTFVMLITEIAAI